MLGITTADAIALGTVAASVLAAFLGSKKGETAKKESPPEPPVAMIGASIVDTTTLINLTTAVNAVAQAMLLGIQSNEKISKDETAERLEQIENASQETTAHMRQLLAKMDQIPVPHETARKTSR